MNYYAVLTDHGAQLIEQAYQHGQVVTITQMAIGDGGGVELEPATSALAVAGEFDRVPLTSGASASSMLGGGVDYESTTHVGKWIRTLGLMDAQGNLIVYSNYPPTYIADKGSTLFRTLGLNIQLPIVHGDAVTVIVERPPYPPATETEYGVVKLATQAQTDAGAADDVVPTPKKLANHYRRGNVVGPVSQSAGLPTGAIIEHGSNANGSYVRWADGTQWCFVEVDLNLNVSKPNAFGSTSGQGYAPVDSQWQFPAPFISNPRAWGNPVGALDHGTATAHVSQVSTTYAQKRAWRVAAGQLTVQYFAVGRWY